MLHTSRRQQKYLATHFSTAADMEAEMAASISKAEHILQYHFRDRLILWEALQATGNNRTYVGTRRFTDGNKRLALLGDTVMKTALLEDWYDGVGSRGKELSGCTYPFYSLMKSRERK